MKKPSKMIDPKVLKVDMLELLAKAKKKGLTVDEAAALLLGQETYAHYIKDKKYVHEWAQSMLQKLAKEQLAILKDDRYVLVPTPILQDTPPAPEEYLPSEVVKRGKQK
jgi:hypothetical protein